MPSASALTIYLFGASALAAGLVTLLHPQRHPSLQSLADDTARASAATPPARAISVAALAMGTYYILLARQENRAFFLATVPVRLFSASVFAQQGVGWGAAAVWEGVGACVTALALVSDEFLLLPSGVTASFRSIIY